MSRRFGLGLAALALVVAPATAQEKLKTQTSWDAVYMGGGKIGHVETKVETLKDPTNAERTLIRVQVDTVLNFKRQKDAITQRVRYGTIETTDGSVLKLDTRVITGETQLRTSGTVIDGKMTLQLDGGGQKQQVVIDWGPEVRGPYAAELSLARKPLKAGETRDERMFIPGLNKLGTLHLIAKQVEPTELGGGVHRELLRIEAPVDGPDGKPMPEATQTLWIDEGGQILKAFSDVFGGMTFYRTTETAAKAPNAKVDLIAEQIIKTPQKLPNPERTRAVLYQLTLTGSDPKDVFPDDRRQRLKPGKAAGSVVLEVKTAGPNDGEAGPEAVGSEFLSPNSQINSDDPVVVAYARKATAGKTDPWEKAQAINRWVAKNLRAKNFTKGFANAAEVAQSLEGDCTEHSVLSAAMCRATGVPARVAIGLVYADHLGGFGYHMWNEVYVNRRWVAMDAAFDQTDVDAVHIKLSESSLDGISPFESFMGVAKVFKKLNLRPLEIR